MVSLSVSVDFSSFIGSGFVSGGSFSRFGFEVRLGAVSFLYSKSLLSFGLLFFSVGFSDSSLCLNLSLSSLLLGVSVTLDNFSLFFDGLQFISVSLHNGGFSILEDLLGKGDLSLGIRPRVSVVDKELSGFLNCSIGINTDLGEILKDGLSRSDDDKEFKDLVDFFLSMGEAWLVDSMVVHLSSDPLLVGIRRLQTALESEARVGLGTFTSLVSRSSVRVLNGVAFDFIGSVVHLLKASTAVDDIPASVDKCGVFRGSLTAVGQVVLMLSLSSVFFGFINFFVQLLLFLLKGFFLFFQSIIHIIEFFYSAGFMCGALLTDSSELLTEICKFLHELRSFFLSARLFQLSE